MTIAALKSPPLPRKSPQQRRSRQMVDIILESAKKILVEYDESAFTLAVLEQVSGVTKGSIYQYFPSLDAIIAALFEQEFVEYVARGRAHVAAMPDQSLDNLLGFIVEDAVRWHKTMYDLHPSFYNEYKLYYDLGHRFDELYGSRNFARQYLAKAIHLEYGSAHVREVEELAHMVLLMLNGLFFSALSFYPQRIVEPQFKAQIISACRAFINSNSLQ